jgi:hypothetical protein
MHHTSPSRGRWILTIGAVMVVGACFLQWWEIGGGAGQLDRNSAIGFSSTTGAVYPMFLAAVATLLLITLPFASERPIAIDHPLAYLLLFGVEVVCFASTVFVMIQASLIPIPPQHGFGFWLAGLGLLVIARGVFEFYEEYHRRLY